MSIQRFNKILIANRGEIAVRIIKACRELDIFSVAVYSTADSDSLHVALADEAHCIGEPEAAKSYLNIDKIIATAQSVGAQAIHPGYGFLAENPLLAQACEKSGITFIGPKAASMGAVASKDAARTLVQTLSIPTIPGLENLAIYDSNLDNQCEAIGYPILLKAAAGGGGLGMRIVEKAAELESAFAAVSREAKQAFGDDGIIVEKYLGQARHIEVQVLADVYGNCVHLHERDCSIQRRRQKIVEESPARNLPDTIKQQLCHAAVTIAKKIGYCGAGTVEFLVNDEQFYFLEMNTRLQVEHGVTEAVTGVDIVQWQIKIAEGEGLSLQQDEIKQTGHAIECRICAENPTLDFIPSNGIISYWQGPVIQRCDSGVHAGSKIGVYYDSLLAKIVSYGDDFSLANRNLQVALSQCALLGLDTNIAYLRKIVSSQPWSEGSIDTNAVTNYHLQWSLPQSEQAINYLVCAAIAMTSTRQDESFWPGKEYCPTSWHIDIAGDRLEVESCPQSESSLVVVTGGETFQCRVATLTQTDNPVELRSELVRLEIEINGRKIRTVGLVVDNSDASKKVSVHCNTIGSATFVLGSSETSKQSSTSEDIVLAPMPAKIVAIHIAVGDEVKSGDELLLLESMKMETRLTASRDGVVKAVHVTENELIESGSPMIEFESE